MNKYTVIKTKSDDFSRSDKGFIDKRVWEGDYSPLTYFKMIYEEGKGFHVYFHCDEKDPPARMKNFGDSVCKDSCMELFANFSPKTSDLYINFEMNSISTLLCCVGRERHGRKSILEYSTILPDVTSFSDGSGWGLNLFIPLSLLFSVYGEFEIKDGYTFFANLYKCGDEMPIKHYLMFNPVKSEVPDFHRPECFAEFTVRQS